MTDKPISQAKDGTWDFRCPIAIGCGPDAADPTQPFTSTGWTDREHAQTRGAQHIGEHGGGEIMEDLNTFRERRGLIPTQPMPATDALKTLEK